MSGLVSMVALVAMQAQSSLAPELQPLASLIGHCWRATFPGTQYTDTHCWSAMPGGRQVRDRHVVHGAPGPYAGESIYRWDPESRRIRYDYYASDGGHSSGFVEASANRLSFPEEAYLSPAGQRMTLRSSIDWESPTAFTGASAIRRGDTWQEVWRMRFDRVAAAPADLTP